MATLKVQDIDHSLSKKGFKKNKTGNKKKKNADHVFYHYHTLAGLKSNIFTKMSHGEKEINDFLIAEMSKQLKVTKMEFFSFVECHLQQPAYEKILREKNFL